MIRKLAAFIVSLLLLIYSAQFGAIQTYAATEQAPHYEHAVNLKLMGLMKGTGTGFELEREATRIEGAVMLVRLLGKENYALQAHLSHPFKDVPTWANDYIGYMYTSGITTGISADTYGSSLKLTAAQYAAFVLRSLNYSEKENDFTYSSSLDKAASTGILSSTAAQGLKAGGSFIRDTIVMMSYNALTAKLKGTSTKLIDKLALQDKSVSEKTAEILGIYTTRLDAFYGTNAGFKLVKTTYGIEIKNYSNLTVILRDNLLLLQPQIVLDVRNYSGDVYADFKKAMEAAKAPIANTNGVSDLLKGWSYRSTGSSLTVSLTYNYTKTAFETAAQNYKSTVYKARHVAAAQDYSLPDYKKELYLHNYLVNKCSYDYAGYLSGNISDSSFKPYGALILGKAVCQGYAEAMKLLCDLSGIECNIVYGTSNGSGSWIDHAWNQVKIGGGYYHVDTTFDDPISNTGEAVLSFKYFNLTDAQISRDHTWDKAAYPSCNSTQYSYSNINTLVAAAQ